MNKSYQGNIRESDLVKQENWYVLKLDIKVFIRNFKMDVSIIYKS